MAEIIDVIVKITDDRKTLQIAPAPITLMPQDGSFIQRLVFERPDGFADDDLVLFLEDDSGPYDPVNLGKGNEYTIPDALTLGEWLRLRVHMVREVTRRRSDATRLAVLHPGSGGDSELAAAVLEIVGGGE